MRAFRENELEISKLHRGSGIALHDVLYPDCYATLFRLSLSLIFGVAAVSLGFAFYQTHTEATALRSDLEHHSQVLADSLAKSAEPLLAKRSNRELQSLTDRLKDRERIAGAAVYDGLGHVVAMTRGLDSRLKGSPAAVLQSMRAAPLLNSCRGMRRAEGCTSPPSRFGITPDLGGVLAIFHDAAYIDSQVSAMWRRALTGVAIQTVLIVSITLLMLRWGIGRPMTAMTQWMREMRAGGTHVRATPPQENLRR